jgi:hypothetical protein
MCDAQSKKGAHKRLASCKLHACCDVDVHGPEPTRVVSCQMIDEPNKQHNLLSVV